MSGVTTGSVFGAASAPTSASLPAFGGSSFGAVTATSGQQAQFTGISITVYYSGVVYTVALYSNPS